MPFGTEAQIWESTGGDGMRFFERVREKRTTPAEPLYLMLALIFALLFSPVIIYPFIVERLIIGAPSWLGPNLADILIGEHLFGTFEENAYGNLLLGLAALFGFVAALVAYALFRPFYRQMAQGEPIPDWKLALPFVGDLPLGYFVTALFAAILYSIAGGPALTLSEVVSPSPVLADIAFAGYVIGSSASKFGIGVWWHRALSQVSSSSPSAR